MTSGRDAAGGRAGLNSPRAARAFAGVVGVALVVLGLLGFVPNPVVGDPAAAPILVTGTIHNLVHLMSGALFLYVALGLSGEAQADGLIGLGIAYAVLLLVTLLSPDLFGILDHDVNTLDHVLHLALAVLALGVGWWARTGALLPTRG